MGMDLKPVNPSADAPRYPKDDKYAPGEVIWGRYNWSQWNALCNLLDKRCVDTSEFKHCNDGDLISEATCREVADAIEASLHEPGNDHWLKDDVILWRTCGGYQQF